MELIKTEGFHYVAIAVATLSNSITYHGLVLIISIQFYLNAFETFWFRREKKKNKPQQKKNFIFTSVMH